ncbi:MAG TPA: hypothetical protein DGH68_02885 [Bacteroidetes bacterium]|jgi:hypothetical protein|nr:hypothetical protein [Bacteroidota bacterium]
MGIRVKNLHNFVGTLKYNQTLTATVNRDLFSVPFAGFISGVRAKLGTAGTGAQATIVDVNLNGTTVFAAATKVTLAATTGVASYSALTSAPTPVAAGDIVSIDIDQIATAPINLAVDVIISRTPLADADHSTNLDDVL